MSIGSIFGAIAGPIIGGLFARDQAEDNRSAQVAMTDATNEKNIALARETQARNEALARETAARNEALQREFAQMGIQWRVADAKAAGLHPVYALTGGGAAYAPSPTVVHDAPRVQAPDVTVDNWAGQMGQDLGRALSMSLDPVQRAERALQLELLQKQVATEDARAAYYRSQAVRETSIGGGLGPMSSSVLVGPGGVKESLSVIDLPVLKDTIRAIPSEVESSRSGDPSSTPGTRPLWSDYDFNGITIRLPSKGASEALESIEPLGAIATAAENVRYHRLLDNAFKFLDAQGRGIRKAWSNLRNPWGRGERLPGREFSPHRDYGTGGKFN